MASEGTHATDPTRRKTQVRVAALAFIMFTAASKLQGRRRRAAVGVNAFPYLVGWSAGCSNRRHRQRSTTAPRSPSSQTHMLRQQLLDTGRGRIVSLLQRGPLTVDDIASKLELSASGVRAQITAMERDGVVRRVGRRPGTTRPSRIFELTPEVEQLLSRAYIPLLAQLVDVFANGLPARQVDALLREAGRKLAGALSSGRPTGTLRSRVMAASELLNEQLGAVTHVEQNGGYVIRGEGCPLSALTGKHAAVCRAMESLVKEFIGASVHECCERAQRPHCCFEIKSKAPA